MLGVNHATVRRAIDALEESLKTRMFDRHGRGLILTQTGELLLEHTKEIEQQTIQIQRKLAGLDSRPTGAIRVSLPPSFALGFISPILAGFSEEFPEIDVHLIPTNKIANLAKAEADVSIRSAYEVDDDVVGRRLVRYNIAAFASPGYLERHPELLAGVGKDAQWIGFGAKRNWVNETPFPDAKTRYIFPEVYSQIAAASEGLGMAWIPGFLGDAEPRLIRIPGAAVLPSRSIWLLLHGDLRHTARVRAFVDYVADYVQRNKSMFS
jgi:DNA-binding transcriptional LysR family regulator